MALDLKDPETDRLAREVANLTGESLTQVVRVSLEQRLRRERLIRGQSPDLIKDMEEITRRVRAMPILNPRGDDEIIGYDEGGLPF